MTIIRGDPFSHQATTCNNFGHTTHNFKLLTFYVVISLLKTCKHPKEQAQGEKPKKIRSGALYAVDSYFDNTFQQSQQPNQCKMYFTAFVSTTFGRPRGRILVL